MNEIVQTVKTIYNRNSNSHDLSSILVKLLDQELTPSEITFLSLVNHLIIDLDNYSKNVVEAKKATTTN